MHVARQIGRARKSGTFVESIGRSLPLIASDRCTIVDAAAERDVTRCASAWASNVGPEIENDIPAPPCGRRYHLDVDLSELDYPPV